jgi:hypothetical protein
MIAHLIYGLNALVDAGQSIEKEKIYELVKQKKLIHFLNENFETRYWDFTSHAKYEEDLCSKLFDGYELYLGDDSFGKLGVEQKHSEKGAFFIFKIKRRVTYMTNIERLKMETRSIDFPDNELSIYLQENGLNETDEYNPQSNANKKAIYSTALQVLESLASDPQLMKSYKDDDISVTNFYENLMTKIDDLTRKVRMMAAIDTETTHLNTFMLFNS